MILKKIDSLNSILLKITFCLVLKKQIIQKEIFNR